jgi:transcriptional antiterminator Rof (Rho-off)
MGFFDFLKGAAVRCPLCGAPDARKSGDRVICTNPMCRNSTQPQSASASGGGPPPAAAKAADIPRGSWQPRQPLTIRYRNFQGVEQTYAAEADSCRRRKNHISVLVAPTGGRITLRRDRIQNLSEVEARCAGRVGEGQKEPTKRERQVLGYHKKHGTTSPLYEQIRAKFPNW